MGGKLAFFKDGCLALKNYNLGPYNDPYFIFVLFKRPKAFFKRPLHFSDVLNVSLSNLIFF